MIKRFFILLLAIVASVGMMNAKVTWNSSNISDLRVRSYQSYSKEGVTLSANSDMVEARWQDFGDESMDGISFNANETGGYTFSNTLGKNFTKIQMTLNSPSSWNYANLGSGWSFSWEPIENKPATVTWTGNASTVDLLKEASDFGGEQVKSIVFYFVGDSEAPDPTYTVALKDGTANADKVTLSATSAVEGATITVTPDDEYEITAFSAYYVVVEDQLGSIYDIDATLNAETGAYSFTMPAYAVTIEATIAAKPVPEGDIYAGFTATAGSGGFSNEGHANLIDNKFTSTDWTKWCADNGYKSVPTGESESCWWIDFEASEALYPTGYILTTGNDSGTEHGRNPKNWVLKAKLNADDAWTTIATVTNDVTMKNKSFKDYKFFVDQSGSYKYFRFEVFANQGANVMQLCQLRLIGTDAPAPAGLQVTELQVPASWQDNPTMLSISDMPGFVAITEAEATAWDAAPAGKVDLIFAFEDNAATALSFKNGVYQAAQAHNITYEDLYAWYSNGDKIFYTGGGSTPTPTPAGTVTVVFEANNNQKEVEVTLPHTFACDFENGNGELDGIIQELYALQYGGYCQAFAVPTATGNAAVTASKDGNNHHIAISEAFEGTATVTGNYIKYLDTEHMGNTAVDYTLTISVQGSDPTPAPTTDPIVIATNTEQSSYTQGSITVSVNYVGDSDGFRLNNDNSASISNSGSSTISKIELVPGWFLNKHSYVRANGAEPNSSSEELITFLNVNSNEVTLSCSVSICIKEVRIYFEEPGGGSTDVIPCTAADLGKVLCTDGSIYATVSEAAAASKTAVAMIAYVDTENGKALALALADDGGEMEWAPAKTTAAAHTPAVSGGTWTLASKDDWNNMITAAGGYEALRDGFSAVGGTNMQQDAYWSSTPVDDLAWIFYFAYGGKWVDDHVDNPSHVRACLAFNIPAAPAAPAYETVMNLINEIPNPVVLTTECKAKIDAARTAFDALSDGDKAQVTNIATLTTAEAAFENVMNIWLSGDCDVILWSDTTLTVRKHAGEGNGAMADYNYASRAPWYSGHWYDPKPNDIVIKSVTIEEGVTHLGDYAFAWMSEMKTVTIPSSVTTIPEDAFYWSQAVDDIYLHTNPSDLQWMQPTKADVQFKPEKGTNAHVPVDLLPVYQEWFKGLNLTYVGDQTPTVLKLEVGMLLNDSDEIYIGPDTTYIQFNCFNAERYLYGKGTFKIIGTEYVPGEVFGMKFEPKSLSYCFMKYYSKGNTSNSFGTNCCTTAIPTQMTVVSGDGTKDNPFVIEPDTKGECVQAEMTTLPQAVSEITYDGEPHTLVAAGISNYGTVQYSIDNGASWSADLPQGINPVTYTIHYRVIGGNACIQGIDYDPNNKVTASIVSPAVENVEAKIAAIPSPVVYTPACEEAIADARSAYDALDDDLKPFVENYDVLTAAEATYDNMKYVSAVEAKINAIPQPVDLKLSTRDSINNARAAYDALTADQKLLVSNYQDLLDAEDALAALNPGGGGAPAGALNGAFTINADGSKIAFSKGNLQYQASTTTWRFATNQYDMIGADNANISDTYTGWIDLFGWGTGNCPTKTSTVDEDYSTFTDWGVNAISNGGNEANLWRTLTRYEWAYLIQTRTNAADLKGQATVADVHGFVLLPDSWTLPAGLSFTASPKNWTTNVYTAEQWAQMEAAGAVFLPATGHRDPEIKGVGDKGWYWSSDVLSDIVAYDFEFNDTISRVFGSRHYFGQPVRLVAEGGGPAPLDSAQAVKDLIEAIPTPVTLDDACVDAIHAAQDAYNALSDAAKGALDDATVQKLTDAEQALKDLNQEVADEVIAKINNIPTPVELKLATRDSIESARTAYDALNAAQQALVSNYQTLLDAEAALAEKNQGGSIPMDIVWDGNTGIEGVSPATTSPAYEGMTVTVGQGSAFSTYQSRLYFTFYSQPNGGFIFANADGSNITKVVIESTTALTSTMTEVDRMGSGWAISNENKTATWTGDADSVSIWKGQSFTNYWVVDKITFTVNGTATPLDSAQHVKDLIDAIPTPLEYPTSGAAIEAALNAYDALSDAAKGALDAADVQKMTDAATQYAALEAIAAIEAIPAEIVYDPAVKAAIETAREKYDALSDPSKALVDDEVVEKLTNAEKAWADLVAKVEHNVSYMGKDGELKNEKVALLHIPDPAPDFNGYEFVRWDVKAGDFLEEGLRIKAIYTPIITTNPQGFDTLAYNGLAQELVKAGVAKEGHIEYSLQPEEPESWSAELPKATFAGVYAIYYKLVREGHADYIAPEPTMATIAKVPVTYVAPTAVENLVYTASNQTLIAAGQTQDGTFEYSLNPTLLDSWSAELPQAKDAGTYSVYYRVQGDLNHLDSVSATPVAVTIAKEELTATADDKNVIYGDAVPAYTVTYAGWQGDDDATVLTGDIAFACEYASTSNVGEYTITPSGVSAANYTITFVNGKVTVAKAESGCIAPVVYDTLVYNGANQTLIIAGQPMGGEMQYSLDTTVLDCWSNSLPQAKDAGTYKVYYRVKGDMNHNDHYYDLITVSIAKAALTATADDKNVVYGDAVPEYTVSYSGWMGTDEASVLTGTIAFACEYAPTSNVGDYTITPSGVDAANYIITFVNGKVTVAKADLMITADDKNVIYGEVAPAFTASYSGWKNSDDASVVSGLTLTSEYLVTSNVGTYDIVPANASATNYAISYTNGTLTVNQAALTITANDTTVIYGDEHPEFTVTYAGWKNTDDESVVSGLQFSTPYAPGSYVGTYAINPNSATALNYAITFVDGTLTVNKAHVYVSDAEAQIAKFADGHANAVVLEQGILNGIKLNDPIAHVTTAAFSSADVAENLTITLFYELTGDAALLNNYNLDPTSDIFTNEGVIIEPFIPDNEEKPEDEEATVNEGIEIYAYGYCDGSGYSLKYHLESGNPDQYKIDFADSRFTDVDWTNLVITGKDGTIDIEIPVDLPTGDYTMTVYFRDSRFDWLESRQFNVTFHVNLPETYVRPLFDNVIALVDTCKCLTDIQWYWRANSTELWQPIEGANGYYYHVDGKLTGEYFVSAKMNGEPTYTCGQTDMETLYGETQKASAPVVKAYPNPVVTTTTVTIENSTEWNHNIRIVNLMGAEVMNATFEGDKTSVEMGNYPQGNYLISVDGITVKVLKK